MELGPARERDADAPAAGNEEREPDVLLAWGGP